MTYGHSAQDGRGDSDKRGGELGEDAHDHEKEAGGVAGLAVGAPGEGDDAVVLPSVNLGVPSRTELGKKRTCANVDMGVMVHKPANSPLNPSANTPP